MKFIQSQIIIKTLQIVCFAIIVVYIRSVVEWIERLQLKRQTRIPGQVKQRL